MAQDWGPASPIQRRFQYSTIAWRLPHLPHLGGQHTPIRPANKQVPGNYDDQWFNLPKAIPLETSGCIHMSSEACGVLLFKNYYVSRILTATEH